jgi:hypothetical protein
MTTTIASLDPQTAYPDAIAVAEMFVDHTYQRDEDTPRTHRLAADWDRRLIGVLEISDRGPDHHPRYAVIDGQHRFQAAKHRDPAAVLVANVHTGLTVADEADLFYKLNHQRRQPSTWDHWRARRAAGDPDVLAIETVVTGHRLTVDMSPADRCVACVAALEKVVRLGGTDLLDVTLDVITAVWDGRRDSLDAPIIGGLALILHHLAGGIDHARLTRCLIDTVPGQVRSKALTLAELTNGTRPTLTALAIMTFYNKGARRSIEVTSRTFGGGSINARSQVRTPKPAPDTQAPACAPQPAPTAFAHLPTSITSGPRPHLYTDDQADAVTQLAGHADAEIAAQLGISPRTVRRIRADLNLGASA